MELSALCAIPTASSLLPAANGQPGENQKKRIETLAAHLCRTILSEFDEVENVAIEVWKPGALSSAKNVGAVIVASRDSR